MQFSKQVIWFQEVARPGLVNQGLLPPKALLDISPGLVWQHLAIGSHRGAAQLLAERMACGAHNMCVLYIYIYICI